MIIKLSIDIKATPEAVCEVVRDWRSWPETFPLTIEQVTNVGASGGALNLCVEHRAEGPVLNVLNPDEQGVIRLAEFKRRYDAEFEFFSAPLSDGARLYVRGTLWLKGWLAMIDCFLTPLAESRVRRFLLEPIRVRAEALAHERSLFRRLRQPDLPEEMEQDVGSQSLWPSARIGSGR